jgi:hypothetical protein
VLEELSREDLTRVVDKAVAELLDAAGVTGPPVDAVALATRHLGLDLGERNRGRGARAATTPEGRQFVAARAVGERLKPDLLRRLGFDASGRRPMMGESLTNLFAGRLLTPSAWFADDAADCGHDLEELKRRYRTAAFDTVAFRLLDLSAPCVVTVVDGGAVSRRRSNAWRVRKELAPAEKECQRRVIESGQPEDVRAGGWTVRGWPVPGVLGGKVILRSVIDDDLAPERSAP